MLKFQILLLKPIFPFSKKTWKHMLHPLYTVECGFTKWYIWFSSTLSPKGFKSHAAPVLKISDVFDFM